MQMLKYRHAALGALQSAYLKTELPQMVPFDAVL